MTVHGFAAQAVVCKNVGPPQNDISISTPVFVPAKVAVHEVVDPPLFTYPMRFAELPTSVIPLPLTEMPVVAAFVLSIHPQKLIPTVGSLTVGVVVTDVVAALKATLVPIAVAKLAP